MVKLIHGADFHLDSPFAGLTPEQAARRRGEQRELLERLGQLARDRGAELVLLAGDLLDGRQTYRETAQALAQSLARPGEQLSRLSPEERRALVRLLAAECRWDGTAVTLTLRWE